VTDLSPACCRSLRCHREQRLQAICEENQYDE